MRYDQVRAEASLVRRSFVEGFVNARISRREGDATSADIDAWESIARKRWDEMYPELAAIANGDE